MATFLVRCLGPLIRASLPSSSAAAEGKGVNLVETANSLWLGGDLEAKALEGLSSCEDLASPPATISSALTPDALPPGLGAANLAEDQLYRWPGVGPTGTNN